MLKKNTHLFTALKFIFHSNYNNKLSLRQNFNFKFMITIAQNIPNLQEKVCAMFFYKIRQDNTHKIDKIVIKNYNPCLYIIESDDIFKIYLTKKSKSTDLINEIGLMYYYGEGLAQNCKLAFKYFELAAKQGNKKDKLRLK